MACGRGTTTPDPAYFEELLLSPEKKPANLV